MSVTAIDLSYHWMPFTGNRAFKADPRLVVRAEGMYYWSHTGTSASSCSSVPRRCPAISSTACSNCATCRW